MNKTRSRIVTFVISALCVLAPTLAFAAFNVDLSNGSTGSDVLSLQQFLIQQGLLDPNLATGNFYSITQAAVQQFQSQHGISPASGYFGPITRSLVNSMIDGSGGGNYGGGGVDALIAALKAQVLQLQAQIQAIIANGGGYGQSCSFANQSISDGSSVVAYQDSSVANGQVCQSENRTCTNGSLSGSYQYSSCTAQTCQVYNLPSCPNGILVSQGLDSNSCQLPALCVPSISFTSDPSPATGAMPLSVTFSSNVYGAIDYGDGNTDTMNNDGDGTFSTTHVYSTAGTYTATLSPVCAGSGCTAIAPKTLTVTVKSSVCPTYNKPTCNVHQTLANEGHDANSCLISPKCITANLTATPTQGQVPTTVQFSAKYIVKTASNYYIDPGDGTGLIAMIDTKCNREGTDGDYLCIGATSHRYAGPGRFVATLQYRYNGKPMDSVSIGIWVSPGNP